MMVKTLLLPLFTLFSMVNSARILAVLPFPGRSHHTFSSKILQALAQKGHEVVEYSPYPPKNPVSNYTHIAILEDLEKEFNGRTFESFMNTLPAHRSIYGFKIRRIWEINYKICDLTFKEESIQKLLKSNSHFDLVLTESTFGEESMLGFGYRFSAPTITLEAFFPWSILNRDAGNILSIASVPDLTSFVFENEFMSLRDKILNFISVSLTLFFYHYSHIPLQESIMKKYLNDSSIPALSEMVVNVSLYLTNSHPAVVNYIQPYTPNIIPIGGINIDSKSTQPTQEIQHFLDSAKHGIIYFSLGTVIPTHLMPTYTLQKFINAFKRIPQHILWKIDLNSTQGIPKNVMITNWAPQVAVLGHPNCKLFITHGGLFSHQEAIHAGVPIIGIAFFSDQMYNVQYLEHRGMGVKLNIETLSEEAIHKAITTVLNNNKFKMNAQQISRVYRDRPMSPAYTATYWVEYVLRHKGAYHLRPASSALSWYQLFLVDVVVAILSIIISLIMMISMLLKFIIKNK